MTTSITFYTNALSENHKQHVPFTVSVPTSALLLDKAKALIPNITTLTDENFLPWCHDFSQTSEVLKLTKGREAATLLLLRAWHLAPDEVQKNVDMGKALISLTTATVVSNSLLVYSAALWRNDGLLCPLSFFDRVPVHITQSPHLLGLVLDQVKINITPAELLDISDQVLQANPIITSVEDIRVERGVLQLDVVRAVGQKADAVPQQTKKQQQQEARKQPQTKRVVEWISYDHLWKVDSNQAIIQQAFIDWGEKVEYINRCPTNRYQINWLPDGGTEQLKVITVQQLDSLGWKSKVFPPLPAEPTRAVTASASPESPSWRRSSVAFMSVLESAVANLLPDPAARSMFLSQVEDQAHLSFLFPLAEPGNTSETGASADGVAYNIDDVVDYGRRKPRRGTVVAAEPSLEHGMVYSIRNHGNRKVKKGCLAIDMKLVHGAAEESTPGGDASADEEKDEDPSTPEEAAVDTPLTAPMSPVTPTSATTARPMLQSPGVTTRGRSNLARSPSDSPGPSSSTFPVLSLPPLQINRLNIERYGPDSYLITNWLSKEDADRQLAVWKKKASQFRLMRHRGNPLARYKAFYCDPLAGSRTMYEYTSSELQSWEEHEWPPEGLQLRDAVRDTLGEDVNSLVANDYRHKDHKITWHVDKPADIAHGTSIATVSLGHARLFQLCPIAEVKHWMDAKKARKEKMDLNREQGIEEKLPAVAPLADVIDIVLPHGSIFVIGPETNEHYMHCIPLSKKKCGRRYGLTFRTIASRWIPDVEVVIRQPPKGETAWDVVHRPKETRDGEATGQNGYAYRSRIYLEPYTPRDPTRLTEEDIMAVRKSMPSRPKLKGRPSRIENSGPDSETGKTEIDVGDGSSEGGESEGSEEEEQEGKKRKRKRTKESSGKKTKQHKVE